MRLIVLCITIFTVLLCNGKNPNFGEEKFEYDLSIGFFQVGKANLNYVHSQQTGKRTMLAHAYSTGIVDFFHNFNFKFTNELDQRTGLPLWATKEFYEGKYHSRNKVRFDHVSRSDSTVVFSDSIGINVVPKNIFDILSGVYHIMNHALTKPFEKGDTISTCCYFTDEVWTLKLVYIGDEPVKTFRGKELCRKFYLIPQKGYFFKNDDDILFWFSKDGLNTPMRIQMRFVLSSIKAELSAYKNSLSPKRPLNP